MALALALCAGAAWAPVLTRAPTRRGAGPVMLGNFPGGNDGGGGFKLPDFGSMFGGADGPREEIDAAYEQPEPSAEVLASFEMDEVELAEQSAKLDALAAKWKRRRIAMEDEKAIQARITRGTTAPSEPHETAGGADCGARF